MSGVGSVGSGEVYWARLEASALAASAACPVWKERKKERKKERTNERKLRISQIQDGGCAPS